MVNYAEAASSDLMNWLDPTSANLRPVYLNDKSRLQLSDCTFIAVISGYSLGDLNSPNVSNQLKNKVFSSFL